jgi:O-antigen/teichoic acid export membrane protein
LAAYFQRGSVIMKISIGFLLRGSAWTIGAYGASTIIRLGSNLILARLLAPEIFGVMLIVTSLRTGLELISDVGISQNIVYNKNADDPDFYNTAWTLQILRSIVLFLIWLAAAIPVSNFYHSPILAHILPVLGIGIPIAGLTSISKSLLQKRLQIVRLNIFDTTIYFISSVAVVLFAYVNPTVWALVWGNLFSTVVATVGSYFLLSNVKQRLRLSRRFIWEIFQYGKWIFVSSIVFFLSTNIDLIYLGKVIPLEALGIYGIARSISDLAGTLVSRLGNLVLFPFIASHSQSPRAELRQQLAPTRAKFLLLAGLGFSLFISTADLAIMIMYDSRYHTATWILPILVFGSWFSLLVTINESTLLGLGRPSYGAISNSLKFAFLLVGLVLSTTSYGLPGGVMVIALADLCRYLPILIGQRRERFSFGAQDLFLTFALFCMIGFWESLRWLTGFGTSFDSLPI